MSITRRGLAELGAGFGALAAGQGVLAQPSVTVDDASRLNATPVRRKTAVSQKSDLGLAALRAEMKAAIQAGRPLIVAGARHSMGGQSIPRGGFALTLADAAVDIDRRARTYRVGAGATWRTVIAQLNAVGLSPKVMQSNHDFTVGGAISVNAHGWPVPFGPISGAVRSLRILLADGSLVDCSPRLQPELFALALGGYGLFGVVVQAELEAAENLWCKPSYQLMPASEFGPRFRAEAHRTGSVMAYGRLSVSRDRFLTEAQLTSHRRVADDRPPSMQTPSGLGFDLSSRLFRAQTGSENGKRLRWRAETSLPGMMPGRVSRNGLLNTSVEVLGPPARGTTDILHEYFLAPERLEPFLAHARRLVPEHGADLLNVTLRYVAADSRSVLSYAPGDRVAAVMFFSQPMTPQAEVRMRRLTEALVDAALAEQGCFYLPYRLHARPDQLRRGYPGLARALAAKRRYDPAGLFRSLMWDHYFAGADHA